MRTIPLHGKVAAGRVALVDDADFDLVGRYRWVAWEHQRSAGGRLNGPYAVTFPKANNWRILRMHTLITGYPRTDHINHDGLDNQRHNLRPATVSQNLQNARKRQGGTSPYKGTFRPAGRTRWFASIWVNGRNRRLGTFATEIEAALAYDMAALEVFGEYACFNFPH